MTLSLLPLALVSYRPSVRPSFSLSPQWHTQFVVDAEIFGHLFTFQASQMCGCASHGATHSCSTEQSSLLPVCGAHRSFQSTRAARLAACAVSSTIATAAAHCSRYARITGKCVGVELRALFGVSETDACDVRAEMRLHRKNEPASDVTRMDKVTVHSSWRLNWSFAGFILIDFKWISHNCQCRRRKRLVAFAAIVPAMATWVCWDNVAD